MRCCFFSRGYKSLDVLSGDTRTTGGAEAQIAYLAAAMAQIGHDVSLIYGEGKGQAERRVVAGVTCIDAVPLWRRPSSLATFCQTIISLSPDLLYARIPSDFLWIMGLYAKYRRETKFVYAFAHDYHCNPWRVYYDDDPHKWFHRIAYALGLKSADVIAFQHENQLPLVSRSLQMRLAHVPNLVRSFHEQARPYDATIYDAIWIATIRPEKQVEEFLALAEAKPDLRFALVGGFGTHLNAGRRRALEVRMQSLGNLDFLGPRRAPEVMALLTQSRVLVNTSQAEGFPNTMLEAWSVGVPVVSLSVDPGGIIEREQLGLVSGGRAALCRDVHLLARTQVLNRQAGERGMAYVRRQHSLETVCRALTRALQEAGFTLAACDVQ